jgi:membrane-associated protein
MYSLEHFIDVSLHIDVYLNTMLTNYGFWTYLVLFLILFCETGLVVTPFLPGDSLLFATGSLAAQAQSGLNVFLLFALLVLASALGNQLNYLIGKNIGPRIFSVKRSWVFNPKHLTEAHQFYEKHGGKTIFFARFIPIIRTFAPFVAGIGSMNRVHFSIYNLASALVWIGSLLSLGYFLGSLPVVKNNFTWVIYAIIVLSLVPTFVAFLSKVFTNQASE